MFWKIKRKMLFAKDGDEGSDFGDFLDINLDDGGSDHVDGQGDDDDNLPPESDDRVDGDFESDDSKDLEDSDDDNEGSEEDDEDGSDDSSDDDSDGASDIEGLSKKLEELEAQNKLLLNLLNKGKDEDSDEPEAEAEAEITNPIESEAFTKLAEAMDWDSDETSMMKDFFSLMMDYNNVTVMKEANKSIPDIVNSTMTQKEKQVAVHKKFYDDNSELSHVKGYVSQVAKDVTKEFKKAQKSFDVQDVLNETAKRAYKALGIKKSGKKKETDEPARGKKRPAFPRKPGVRKAPVKKSSFGKDVEAMIELDY